MVYALIGSIVYTRFQRETPPTSVTRPVTIAACEAGNSRQLGEASFWTDQTISADLRLDYRYNRKR